MTQSEPVRDSERLIEHTDVFIKMSARMAENGTPIHTIINALAGAIISVCHACNVPADTVSQTLREAARQAPILMKQQDELIKQSGKPN